MAKPPKGAAVRVPLVPRSRPAEPSYTRKALASWTEGTVLVTGYVDERARLGEIAVF